MKADSTHIEFALEPTQYYQKPQLGFELYEEAFKFCRAQNISDAVRCCRELYQIGLDSSNSYVQGIATYLLASVYFAIGARGNDWERAAEYFEQSAGMFHTYSDKRSEHNEAVAWFSLGRLYEKQCEAGKCRYEDTIAAYIRARDLFDAKKDRLFDIADGSQRRVEQKFRIFLAQQKPPPPPLTEAQTIVAALDFSVQIIPRRRAAQGTSGLAVNEQMILQNIDNWRNAILKESNGCLERQYRAEVRMVMALQPGKLWGTLLLTAVGSSALAISQKHKNLGAEAEVLRCDVATIIKQETLKIIEKTVARDLLPNVIVDIEPPSFYVPIAAKVSAAPVPQTPQRAKPSFPLLRLVATWSLIFIGIVIAIFAFAGIDRIVLSNYTVFLFFVGFLIVLLPSLFPFLVLLIAGQLVYRLDKQCAAIEEIRGRIWIIEEPGWHWLFPFFEQLLTVIPLTPQQFQWSRRELKATDGFSVLLNITLEYRFAEIENFWRNLGTILQYDHVFEIRRPFSTAEIVRVIDQRINDLLSPELEKFVGDPAKRGIFDDDAELTRRVRAMLSPELDTLGLELLKLNLQAYM